MTENKLKICLAAATRGRPDIARLLVESARDTAKNPDVVDIGFYVDKDDPEVTGYQQKLQPLMSGPGNLRLEIGDPIGAPRGCTHMASLSEADTLIMSMSDDLVFQTPGWDEKVLSVAAEYPDGIFCLYCDDGALGEEQASLPAVGRQWFDLMGYLCHPLFEHYYCDIWSQELAKLIDRLRYVPDVLIEHRHHAVGKAQKDSTYERQTTLFGGRSKRDQTTFERYQRYMHVDAAVLLRHIKQAEGVACKVQIGLTRA